MTGVRDGRAVTVQVGVAGSAVAVAVAGIAVGVCVSGTAVLVMWVVGDGVAVAGWETAAGARAQPSVNTMRSNRDTIFCRRLLMFVFGSLQATGFFPQEMATINSKISIAESGHFSG